MSFLKRITPNTSKRLVYLILLILLPFINSVGQIDVARATNDSTCATNVSVTGGTYFIAGAASGGSRTCYLVFTSGDSTSGVNSVYASWTSSIAIDYLMVGGGGAGGTSTDRTAGGGGAGGVLNGTYNADSVFGNTVVSYITVGAGGTAQTSCTSSCATANGKDSLLTVNGNSALTAKGGGFGAYQYSNSSYTKAGNGGSGGGAQHNAGSYVGASNAGKGTSGQGNNGGTDGYDGGGSGPFVGAGGGGAGAAGANGGSTTPGNGGVGTNSYSTWCSDIRTSGAGSGILDSSWCSDGYIAGGGAGGMQFTSTTQQTGFYSGNAASGGQGGGGTGAVGLTTTTTITKSPVAGLANTGGGGGGGASASTNNVAGGNGGSGIVIFRWTLSARTLSFTTAPTSLKYYETAQLSATASAGSGTVTYSGDSNCSVSGTTVTALKSSGTCTVTASVGANGSYNAATTTASINLSQNSITITADAKSVSYGGAAPTYTYTATGLKNGESTTVFTTQPTCTSTYTTSTSVSSSPVSITCSGAAATNYTFTYVDGNLTVNKINSTISSFTVPSLIYGSAATLSATAAMAGSFTFNVGGSAISGCSNQATAGSSPFTATCSYTPSSMSQVTFTLDFTPTSGNYNAITSQNSTNATPSKASQTITITSTTPTSAVVGGTTYTPTGTSSSALTIAISIDSTSSTKCSISGGVISFLAAGTCLVNYNQAGNTYYNAATQAQESITVGQGTQAGLTISQSTSTFTYNGAYSVSPSFSTTGGTGNGAVTYAIYAGGTASGCALSSSAANATLTATSAGTCLIQATKAADTNYLSQTSSNQVTFTFNLSNQNGLTISETSTYTTYNGSAFSLAPGFSATGGSGTGAITYAIYSGGTATGCSLSDNTATATLTATSSGSCKIQATKAADSGYNAMASNVLTFVFNKANQATLTLYQTSGSANYNGTGYSAVPNYRTGGGSTGGTVSYFVIDGTATGCALSDTTAMATLTASTNGTCWTYGIMSGNDYYNAYTSGTISYTFNKINQSALNISATTYTSSGTGTSYSMVPGLSVTGGGGTGAVTYSIVSGSSASNCALSDSTATATLTATSSGICWIQAVKAADVGYNQVTSSTLIFTFKTLLDVPTFSTVTKYGNGYLVKVTNYSSSNTYTFSVASGHYTQGVAVGSNLSIIVSGINAGVIDTLTVTASRSGFYTQNTASVAGSSSDKSSYTTCSPTVTTSGGVTTFKFTTSTSTSDNNCQWTVPSGITNASKVVIVGGGGGGGYAGNGASGGAGAVLSTSNYTLTPGAVMNFTVGGGGYAKSMSTAGPGVNGNNTIFDGVIALGGGGGAGGSAIDTPYVNNGLPGGSGGGATNEGSNGVAGTSYATADCNCSNSVWTILGNSGGTASGATGGGGGGAGGAASGTTAGTGNTSLISGVTLGAGGSFTTTPTSNTGSGGGSNVNGSAGVIYIQVAAPIIDTLTVTSGYTVGGTRTVIQGSNLGGTTSVKFGTQSATIETNTATTISVITPFNGQGAQDVTVVASAGTVTATSAFTYVLTPQDTVTISANTLAKSFPYQIQPNFSLSGGNGSGGNAFGIVSGGTATNCSLSSGSYAAQLNASSSGTCLIQGTKATDGIYAAKDSANTLTFTFSKATQDTLTVSQVRSSTTYASTTDTYYQVPGLSISGGNGLGATSFIIKSGGTATNCTSTYIGSNWYIKADSWGTCLVQGVRGTDTNYLEKISNNYVTYTFNANNQSALTISETLTTSAYNGSTFTAIPGFKTSGGSGTGAVTYSIYSGGTASNCALSDNSATATLTATSQGTCFIQAFKASDYKYDSSTSTNYATFTFTLANQSALTISATTISAVYVDANTSVSPGLSVTGGSGTGAVTYAIVSGGSASGCTLNGNTETATVKASSSGTCFIQATKAGDSTYNSISSGNLTFTFNPAEQATLYIAESISSAAKSGSTYSATPSFSTTGGSGTGAVTYSIATGGTATGCALSSSAANAILSATSAGTCFIQATKAASGNYNSANSATITFTFTEPLAMSTPTNGISASVDNAYTLNLAPLVTGGTAPYTFSQVSGFAIPSWTTLTSAGVLSGTPLSANQGISSQIKIKVTDANSANVTTNGFYISVTPCAMSATGVTYVSASTSYCIIKFTGSTGSWNVPTGVTNASVLVVGGGGGGGGGSIASGDGARGGGGGGGGGAVTTNTNFAISSTTVSVTVGTAGSGGSANNTSGGYGSAGGNGGSSTFGSITSAGGFGGGVQSGATSTDAGGDGGSSGGSSYSGGANDWEGAGGGAGAGGNGYGGCDIPGKGGNGGIGGVGLSNSITGSLVIYAAGGGGGGTYNTTNDTCSTAARAAAGGSSGVGGIGAIYGSTAGVGTVNTGSGGGGGAGYSDSTHQATSGGNGAAGVIFAKYISPAVVTTNKDSTGDTITVTSGTTITFIETTTALTDNSFTRTITWQYSTNSGSTWATENATATSGGYNQATYAFAARCGMHNSNTCAANSVQIWYRALIADTDGTLLTNSYSPVITVTINAKPNTKLVITTSMSGSNVILNSTGGGGTGAKSYSLVSGGTATSCGISGTTLSATSSGTCKVQPAQAADNDYQASSGDVVTIVLNYLYTTQINQWVAPIGNHGIGGMVQNPGVENNSQATQASTLAITSLSATSGAAGSTVIITGTGFLDGSGNSRISGISYNLDNVTYTINSSTSITITIPSSESSGTSDNFTVLPVSGATIFSADTFTIP